KDLKDCNKYPGRATPQGAAQPADVTSSMSDFFLGVRIFAAPLDGGPIRMLADPLRNVGLRGHHTLPQRKVRGKHQIPLLTSGRRSHSAYRDDQIYGVH